MLSPRSVRRIAAVLLALTGVAAGAPDETQPEAGELRRQWLPRLDRVASLYRDSALSFACTELISWLDLQGRSRRLRFDYVYVFDAEKGLRDYRTDATRSDDREVSPAKYGVPRYLENGYSWAFTFLRTRWPYHRYEMMEQKKVLGRPAVAIRFESIRPYRAGVNEWDGTAWIDKETAQILRVTAHRPPGYHAEDLAWSGEEGTLAEEVLTEFTFEENGMRFPGKIRIDLRRTATPGGPPSGGVVLRVEQVYRNYQFFRVRTSEEILKIVLGSSAAATDAPRR